MLGIKIKGQFLNLYESTTISFELSYDMGIITDFTDNLNGGLSFPVDIPIDGNQAILGPINRLDVTGILLQDEYCEVWIDGVLFLIGKATIKQSGNRTASIFMIFNEAKSFSDTSLLEIDLGGDRPIGADTAARLAHAKATATNPLDYDYVFCPVLNPKFGQSHKPAPVLNTHMQNYWNKDTESFKEEIAAIATPFIRMDYLLTRIFAHLGYTLDNQWQNTDELKQLLIYNNRDISEVPESWPTTINLTNHVPARSCLEFIKSTCATFALSLRMDPLAKHATLVPIRTLIEAGEFDNWTDKAGEDYTFTSDKDFISKLRYDIDTDDDLSVQYGGTNVITYFAFGEGLTARAMFADDEFGLRYAIADNSYYNIKNQIDFDADYTTQDLRDVKIPGSDKEYVSPLIPMWNSFNLGVDGYMDDDLPFQQWMVPHIQCYGYVPYVPDVHYQQLAIRLMFYRGFQPYDEGIDGTYPMAGITAYNIRGDKVGDHSLLWNREDGIYEKYWKPVLTMLAKKKNVTRTMHLTIGDLLKFRYTQKYRIENQNVFVTKLRLSASIRGLSPVECVMMTL